MKSSPLIPVAEALAKVVNGAAPLPSENVRLNEADGRVLAEDVKSLRTQPPFDVSAMHGYAARAADLASGKLLQVVGESAAGHKLERELKSGEAARIFTGAVVPHGADVVVEQESATREGDRVTLAVYEAGKNIRPAGIDFREGDVLLKKGLRLSPRALGLAASMDHATLACAKRPRVAIFSTGDELCSIGAPLAEGAVYDSNRYTLFGMLSRMGCDLLDLGVVADDPPLLAETFRQAAAAADVVLTSGGVSVGEADFVRPLMAELGEVLFWKIAMKPGRPLAFGRIGAAAGNADGGAWLFGLPGNPVAVMVTFYQFVREALYRLMGADPLPVVPLLPAVCEHSLKKLPGRSEYQRGILSQTAGGWRVRPAAAQGSGILRSMAEANCFIVLGHERGSVAAGDVVEVQLFDGLV